MFVFSVKDGPTANIQNIRTEEIELIDEEDTPPPVPDTPRRLQYDRNYDKTPSIPEEDERNGDKDNKFRRNKTIMIVIATKLNIYTFVPFCFTLPMRLAKK